MTRSGARFKKQSKHRETKILTFWPIKASLTLKTVSLQLNGILMMWKIQQAMQDDAIRTARIHPGNVTGMKCSYGEISNPLTRLPRSRLEKLRSREPSQPALSYEHIENFTKGGAYRFLTVWTPDKGLTGKARSRKAGQPG